MADMSLGDGIDLLQRRAKVVRILLIAGFILTLGLVTGMFGELRGHITVVNGHIIVDNPYLHRIEIRHLIVPLLYAGIEIVTVIFFAMWIYRAAANVAAARVPGFDYTPGWAVGWYFVPIANLFKPFSAMRQIWNASHGQRGNRLNHTTGWLALWWGCWILSNIGALIPFRVNISQSLTELLQMAASAASLAVYPTAYRMVDRITVAQRERLISAHIFA